MRALVLLVLLASHAATAAAQAPPPDLPTYRAWLREALAASQRNDRIGLDAAAARLVATSAVTVDDQSQLTADNRWLAEALRTDDPDFPVITQRLAAIIAALQLPPGA